MLSVIKGGTEYQLDDGTISYFVGDAGWGFAPLHRLTERGPLQHGETDLGFRLDPRKGIIVLFIKGESRNDLYSKRDSLYSIFAPSDSPLKLRWTLDVTRQIDCFLIDNQMSSEEQYGFVQKTSFGFLCPDPTFYDPNGVGLDFALGGGSDSLTVPMAVPMVVGASVLDATTAISYNGNWRTYPHQIRITGPITDPVITNQTTGEVLDFTGITITGGNYYEIDLRYGYKTVLSNTGVNKVGDLTDDSDLATWHIAADPEAAGGSNSINVTGTSVTESTSVQISYFERYLGR